MFWKVTISQTKYLLKKKEAMLVFLLLFGLVIYNFIGNVLAFQGSDVVVMYHPMKLMLLSYNRINYNADNTLLLIQWYPLLIAFPAGFALSKEYQTGINVYMSTRLGTNMYCLSKVVASFLTTATVFILPFLMEYILNCVSFPLKSMGDLTNWSNYDKDYLADVSNYFMADLFKKNPYIYAMVGILLLGVVSGILGAMTVVISGLIKIKFNLFLLLPAMVLLNVSTMLTKQTSSFSYRWYDYLFLFNEWKKSSLFFLIVVGILVLFVVTGARFASRKDCL